LLEARDVEVRFGAHRIPAVAGVSLTVEAGAAVGIVGESGSGKTTLGRVLVGALDPTSGEVRVDGRPWTDIRRRDALRRNVQMIFQDPYGSLTPTLTPRSAVAEVVQVWESLSKREALLRAEDLLREVGFARDAMDRRPEALSGGQCQRVGIARALACEPQLLVADEPTSALDVSVQAQILNLLATLRERRGLALLLVSHDLGVIRYATDEALVMYAGHVVERGATADLFERPQHPYTRLLIDSIPNAPGGAAPARNDVAEGAGCVFAPRCAHMQPDCLERQPPLAPVRGRPVACFHPLGGA
jgi:oligopeptide/dipeptide ABC transporter ATP-binding protein